VNPWTLLLDILGGILAFFYQIIPVYGIAIILLTLTVGMVLFPLTLKQTRSMKAMQEIQPEVKRLQKELKGDREELNKQLMELYKERGVNPAAGCLPLLLQMPIWFALFSVLRTGSGIPRTSALWEAVGPAKELLDAMREAGALALTGSFDYLLDGVNKTVDVAQTFRPVRFLDMNLLINPSDAFSVGLVTFIPYAILLVLIIAAGYYQQVQTTRNRKDDGQQQSSQMQGMQNALKIMPVFFGFISWSLPTGLDLYFAVSNVFRIGQQAWILRLDRPDEGGFPAKIDNGGGDEGSDDAAPRRPSPNASKKRRGRRRK
jgi:YidC/Oxa1 family membrane protein insertase